MSEQNKKQKPEKEKKENSGPGYFEVIVISLMLAGLALFGYDRIFAQKIKVLDLKKYLRTQKALLTAGEITGQQWRDNLDQLEQILNSAAGRHRNHIIVLKEVVLRNGEEISVNEWQQKQN